MSNRSIGWINAKGSSDGKDLTFWLQSPSNKNKDFFLNQREAIDSKVVDDFKK